MAETDRTVVPPLGVGRVVTTVSRSPLSATGSPLHWLSTTTAGRSITLTTVCVYAGTGRRARIASERASAHYRYQQAPAEGVRGCHVRPSSYACPNPRILRYRPAHPEDRLVADDLADGRGQGLEQGPALGRELAGHGVQDELGAIRGAHQHQD